ncbi:MAG TPA: nucleotidyl transferase AbiEii/AbiGii toxin family protein [Candidatus Eisenbergiella merdavium]|uniref:Nucleotidyl transferase AbiEii/AbiGii toxin family protein n=1 Tax=Candidatus Eisenbergiella merdavium TaxID=2838551 RepID=A0A9D2NCK9_9FIRM|nr:nucleotidyl transferase AbiEii/AbiGii toxin family protein [Candidatus Eisenbergiella merdavium]
MNLHLDPEAFEELVTAASNELHIPAGIIEKDYYVTLALRELNSRIKSMVFKGGTSLTKCYQILNRFSEDIDISYAASEGIPGESRKRQLKKAIVSSMEALQFPIINLNDTRSRRSYNCYRATYSTRYASVAELRPELMIETYIALLPFPTVTRMADNYIHLFLKDTNQEHLAERFNLMPFLVTTQAIERTLVDKIFALCDYYLTDKTERHSRHLYDIYQILEHASPDQSLVPLIQEVRQLRSQLSICPSAKENFCIHDILTEIIEKDIYKADYDNITRNLLFTYLPYETAVNGLKKFLDQGYFK